MMKTANTVVQELKGKVILLHGFFSGEFFDKLIGRKEENIFVLEGRPTLESGQHICNKILKRGVTPTIIADNMAGFLFAQNCVKEVWVSSHGEQHGQWIVPTGSLILKVLAESHHVSFNVFEGERSLDAGTSPADLISFNGIVVAPDKTKTYIPLWDLIPCENVK